MMAQRWHVFSFKTAGALIKADPAPRAAIKENKVIS